MTTAATSILDDYQTPEQLAADLGVCTMTLQRWRACGDGPPVTKVGRAIYYKRASVRAWLERREQRRERVA
jgi:predicted DNA-binding transcriptional regulator AlpA